MSKLVAFLVAAAGASTVSVGGNFLLRKGRGDTQTGQSNQAQDTTNDIEFETLDNFKTGKGGTCVKSKFEELDFDSKGNQLDSSTHTISNTHFSSATGNDVSSCLVVNWARQDTNPAPSDGKWKGYFRWLWAFTKGDKGMIVFATTKPTTEASKVDLEGGIYFLTKNSSTNKWSIEKYKEHTSTASKKVEGEKLDEWFPKKGEGIGSLAKAEGAGETKEDYWWFLKDKEDAKKICVSSTSETCSVSASTSSFKKSWTWEPKKDQDSSSSAKEISKWSSNIEGTITNIFGTEGLTLTGAFSSFQGTWK